MSGTEYFDKIVVKQLVFADTGKVISGATGVDGLVVASPGVKQIIGSTPTAPANTSGSAGASYTATEQGIINNLVTQVNSLTAVLKSAGHLK